ncbi:M13 family metallopeptidase [Rivibacter subsaxonicus]|nr:M13-type metalloendopeptidase [Rivibacter subsaxonicus]
MFVVRSLSLSSLAIAAALALGAALPAQAQNKPSALAPASGIERGAIDPAVRAQDDLFRHVNGTWLKNEPIPADRATTGAFDQIYENTQLKLRALIDEAAANPKNADARKLGDLYASFMDEARLETLGVKPLAAELAAIDAVRSRDELPALMARMARLGVSAPLDMNIHQDAKDATVYVADLAQGGLGLPDRDYYLQADDARFAEVRARYEAYLSKIATLAGVPAERAAADARAVLALETALAKAQWSRVENRDPVKTYNRVELKGLPTLTRAIDWNAYLQAAGLAGKAKYLIVSQPSYVTGLGQQIEGAPLESWKAYCRTRLLSAYAPYLGRDLVDARFAFVGTTLQGTPELAPRWKRGVTLVDGSVGELLGKLYVDRHFPPGHQARMEALVANLMEAYRQSIDTLDWMSPATKKEAKAKLAKFTPKIGYPKQWRDYSALVIKRDDLAGNVMRANGFEFERNLAKLGKPVDRGEWFMTPQTINAYYNPELNEIVFPAAILQPPFFDATADDAMNYGAIGAIIGHEISHGFDDQGSQYDGEGNLRDWWTKEDRERFAKKTQALVAQYNAYSPVKGYHVNGELTLGENIADVSGLAIAHKAYRLSLAGKDAPVIEGMSGDVRFFYGYAQAWRGKSREAALVQQLKSDPHSPEEFRANGGAKNQDSFFDTFAVKPGDGLWLAPAERVKIW